MICVNDLWGPVDERENVGGGSVRVGARAIRILVSAHKIRPLSSLQNIKI